MMSKKELLLKPVWDYKDIMNYLDVKHSYAYEIKQRAIKEHEGAVRIGSQYVKTDSVLALYGTTRKAELKLYDPSESESANEEELH